MRNHSLSLLIFLVFVFPLVLVQAQKPKTTALYIFGDSSADSGNNNVLVTTAKSNYAPYGIDFVNGATGRFTNGKTNPDFQAEFLGLPFVPAYLSLSTTERNMSLTGYNYTSGGAGILIETGSRLGTVLPFDKQLDLFQETINSELSGVFNCSDYLSKAIFMIYMGNNDYVNNYLQPDLYPSSTVYSPQAFAQLLTDKFSQQLQRLYKMGARKIVVIGLVPLGCIPNQIYQSSPTNNGSCVERVNQIVAEFNNRLPTLLTQLNSTLPGSFFVLGDVYGLVYDIIKKPSNYGLSVTNRPCCVAGVDGTSTCTPLLQPCEDRNGYYFWDGYHSTQFGNMITAMMCFNGSTICKPNIQQLAQV